MNETDFILFLDSLMWEGYAEQYKHEQAAAYYDELVEFLNQHTNGNQANNKGKKRAA